MKITPKAQTRIEKILDAAVEVFTRKGYKDAGMEDIVTESQTSKGGIYFHFPNKQAIFLTLLDRAAQMLLSRAKEAMFTEPDLMKRGDQVLATTLETFGSHRHMTRLFLVEAFGAGREFNQKIMEMHNAFSGLIQAYLDELIAAKLIAPIDTKLASVAWFGAINEVVVQWILSGQPQNLHEVYPALRDMLRRSVGLPFEE
jgi:TetR/AcrR family transcriptional regulator, fatty acid metabolism regulator protein